MILTYGGQTIDLFGKKHFPNSPPKEILLQLSGGLDSASLLFLICNNFPNMKIRIFTGKDRNAPFDSECAIDIVEYVKELFPQHNIISHDILEYWEKDPKVIQEIKDLNIKTNNIRKEWDENKIISSIAKPYLLGKLLSEVKRKYGYEDHELLNLISVTKNPPEQYMQDRGFFHLSERERDEDQPPVVYDNAYLPYSTVNKKFVADVYAQHKLDTLKDLTGSCIGTFNETKGFSETCKKCFWCHEKYWAFGHY